MALLHRSHHEHPEDDPRRSSGFTKFVYIVFVLNVLAVLLLLVGVIAGWFSLDAGRGDDDRYRMGVVVDGKEVGSDIDDTMNAASNMSETAKAASDLETLDGRLIASDPAQQQFTLSVKDKSHQIAVTDATEYEGDGISGLSDLEPGELLRVTVQTKNDRVFASKVTKKTTDQE